jgi:hypothetical protein
MIEMTRYRCYSVYRFRFSGSWVCSASLMGFAT